MSNELPIACDLAALSLEQRALQVPQANFLLSQVAQEVHELTNGYAFRFAAADYQQVVEFIANERLCCQFFHFALEIPPAQGALWLQITGSQGVKEFVQNTLVQAPVPTH